MALNKIFCDLLVQVINECRSHGLDKYLHSHSLMTADKLRANANFANKIKNIQDYVIEKLDDIDVVVQRFLVAYGHLPFILFSNLVCFLVSPIPTFYYDHHQSEMVVDLREQTYQKATKNNC